MTAFSRTLLAAAALLLAVPLLNAQASESAIVGQMRQLRSLAADKRPAATVKVAEDIRTLPAGQKKVSFAYNLANLVTEGDQGAATVQAVADVLSQSLAESPVAAKNDQPAAPYMELAR